MDDENGVPVDLINMTPKQRQKEFKATQKELRSKDMQIKLNAMKKLADLTYFKEGGCIPVFLQSLYPKKVSFQ